jgi:SAM-dependent methyltransferase
VDAPRRRDERVDESLRRMSRAPQYNRWLIERARPHLGARVLDVGAGIGTFTSVIAASADEVVAVEPDEQILEGLESAVGSLPNVRIATVPVERLHEVGDGFDAVVCFNVLEHIADDGAALRAFHDRLRPGGTLLLLVPAHPFLFGSIDRTLSHERRYARSGLARALVRNGFSLDELRYVNPLGAVGWFVSSRVFRREHVPEGPLVLYDRLVPLLRALDRAPSPFGLSLWAVARRDAS